jgi:hypothetical protein
MTCKLRFRSDGNYSRGQDTTIYNINHLRIDITELDNLAEVISTYNLANGTVGTADNY